jgi:hypothetical protein
MQAATIVINRLAGKRIRLAWVKVRMGAPMLRRKITRRVPRGT